jgi:hypothetical protein
MGRWGGTGRRAALLAALLCAATAALRARAAGATQRFGPIQLSGNLQTQNLVRHPDAGTYQFIQNRNTARLRLDYDWLLAGRFLERYDVPFLERSRLLVLWRGVYDSIYDLTPGFVEKETLHGRAYEGRTFYDYAREQLGLPRRALTLAGWPRSARDAVKFENQLREAYLDVRFRQLPLTIRAGRQQIVWGESDNFRMLDRVNTLDLTWHFVQEVPPPAFGWDELRRPFWMFKFLYELGDVWRLSQSFVEWYWNPGDWYPAKQAFLPRPWGLRIYDPLTNPVDGVFRRGLCETAPNSRCTRLMNGTRLFQQGDYSRNPAENSQVGVRYHAIAPGGVEFTVAYLHQRFGGDDGTPYAPIRGLPKTDRNVDRAFNELLPRGVFPAEFFAPYVHTVGAAANYSDEAFTQTVFRFETVYDFGLPFFDLARETVVDRPPLPGITRKDMWKGMLAFDRPTWIRWINRKTTVFLTGQFFWHYLVDNTDCAPQVVANMTAAARARAGIHSCLVGPLDLPSLVRLNATPEAPAWRDKIRDWETLVTFGGTSFYRGGSIVPAAGVAVDPVNHFGMEAFWTVDYVVRNDLVVNLAQRYFVTPRGRAEPVFDPWGFHSMSAGRSETSLRLTYQF